MTENIFNNINKIFKELFEINIKINMDGKYKIIK